MKEIIRSIILKEKECEERVRQARADAEQAVRAAEQESDAKLQSMRRAAELEAGEELANAAKAADREYAETLDRLGKDDGRIDGTARESIAADCLEMLLHPSNGTGPGEARLGSRGSKG